MFGKIGVTAMGGDSKTVVEKIIKFENNGIKFSYIVENIKTELLWNSLIFEIYKERISVNKTEIEEQLKLIEQKKEIEEFLISEMIIKSVHSN